MNAVTNIANDTTAGPEGQVFPEEARTAFAAAYPEQPLVIPHRLRDHPLLGLDALADLGAQVEYYDPHIPEVTPTREHARWTGTKSIEWTPENVAAFDCILIATNHETFDLASLLQAGDLIVDTRNAIAKSGLTSRDGQVVKA